MLYVVSQSLFRLCRLGHYTVPNEMDEVCNWLHVRLGLDGSHS